VDQQAGVLPDQGPYIEYFFSSDNEIVRASEAIAALSNGTRLRILQLLESREMSVVEMTRMIDGHSQSSVSQHLAALRKAGLVHCRKESTRMVYRVDDVRLYPLLDMIKSVFCPPGRH